MKNKIIKLICSIKSYTFVLIGILIVFLTLGLGLYISYKNMILGVFIGVSGYVIVLGIALIRQSQGMKE